MASIVGRELGEVLGRGEGELGALGRSVGETGETFAKDMTSTLSREETSILENIRTETASLEKAAQESETAARVEPEFNKAVDHGELKVGEEKVTLKEAEKSTIGASEKAATSLKTRFTSTIKAFFSKLKSYMTGPLGKALITATGEVMKYMFIADMVKEATQGIDKIVKDATGHGISDSGLTPEQLKRKTQLDTLLHLLSALTNVVLGMKETLQNAAQFDSHGDQDDKTSGAYLAMDMSARNTLHIKQAVSDALEGSTKVLLNVKETHDALGITKATTATDTAKAAFVAKILNSKTILQTAIAKLDLGILEDFKAKILTLQTVAKTAVDATYRDPTEHQTMAMFFKMPVNWPATERAIENFIVIATPIGTPNGTSPSN